MSTKGRISCFRPYKWRVYGRERRKSPEGQVKKRDKKEITELNKQREELFGQWIFKKAIDEEFVRKEGAHVYLKIKQLQDEYDEI